MVDLALATRELIAANNIVDGYVRPIAWRGAEQRVVSAQATKIHLALAAWDWPAYFGAGQRRPHEMGELHRTGPMVPLPDIYG
jgi:branched-chain amino acid aminotransferase